MPCYCDSKAYNERVYNNLGVLRMAAGKGETPERDRSQVISVGLRPAAIYLLKQLAAEHGGAGRAIQIAVELLRLRRKPVKLQELKGNEPQQPFSFAVFPRTLALINRLAHQHYGTRGNVIRACIQVLYESANVKVLFDIGLDEDRISDDKPKP
jgi:hypothetical protein